MFGYRFRSIVATLLIAGMAWGAKVSAADPAGAVTRSATGTRPAVGVNFHAMWGDYTDAQRLAVLDKLAAAGVEWVRVDIGWASLQEQGRGLYSDWAFKRADFIVNEARARGINVLGMLWSTPGWANGNAGTIHPPTDPADYGSIARYVAEYFRGRVAAWEVWNEPNLASFWGADAATYVGLLKAAYPQFKAGDPSAKVVLGGPAYNDTGWLTQVYAAGAAGWFDVMSTHPYQGPANLAPEAPDTTGTNIWLISHATAVRNLMASYGDGAKEIWFTEFGWSSHDNAPGTPNWDLGVTLEQQGDYFVRTIEYLKTSHPYVTNVFWYNERNRATGDLQLDNYGLLYRDLTAKPVYTALQSYLKGSGSEALPADTATVSGQITARRGAAISGATVTWKGPQSGKTLTNATGDYSVSGLPAGTYKFIANATGCRRRATSVELTPGQQLTLSFALRC